MDICLGITVSDRVEALTRTLEHWSLVRGVAQTPILFIVEPTNRLDAVIAQLTEFCTWLREENPHSLAGISCNDEVRGPAGNVHFAMSTMLQAVPYAVLADEDVLVSSDILEYHRWAAEAYVMDGSLTAVCSFQRTNGPADLAARLPTFSPHVWGTWTDRWVETIAPNWDPDDWDHHLARRVVPRSRTECLFPALSRSQYAGTGRKQATRFWVPGVPSFTYREAAAPASR